MLVVTGPVETEDEVAEDVVCGFELVETVLVFGAVEDEEADEELRILAPTRSVRTMAQIPFACRLWFRRDAGR